MKTIKMIGLTGKAGAGKDTAGFLLEEMINSRMNAADPDAADMTEVDLIFSTQRVVIDSIAEPLRVMALQYGFTRAQIYDRELKEAHDINLKYSPRRFMQLMGDLLRKQFGNDVLLGMLGRRIYNRGEGIFHIITDIRYDLEAEFVHEHGGAVIEIERDAAGLQDDGKLHPTEQGIDPELIDWHVDNNGELGNLMTGLKEYLESVEVGDCKTV